MSRDHAQLTQCDVSVVICTVNRPALLPQAVATVARQHNRLGLYYEIVVVDNSRDGAAQRAVAELALQHAVPIRYVAERRAGFAASRNAGVRATTSELLAFFDDDQEASPGWLCALTDTLRRFDADMAFGPLLPVFEGGRAPVWDPLGRHYTRSYDLPTGTEIGGKSTGNVLMKRSTCLVDEEPFAHELGSSGGEDFDFFLRMKLRGRKLVWAAEAWATELQPRETQTLGYRAFRIFCQNQTYVRIEARNSDNPLATKLELMVTGATQVLICLLPGLASWLLPPVRPLVEARLKLCGGLGKMLWMLPSRLYAKRYP